jgi:tetratricopeptide (TPR) repeat protein
MLRINQSNLAEDEDQALDLYDEAIQFFKKAASLDPGTSYFHFFFRFLICYLDNAKLAEMVKVLDAYQEVDEE